VQTVLNEQPFSGHVFVFAAAEATSSSFCGGTVMGYVLFSSALERGRFIWPQATEGTVCLTRAQLSMLLEGIDWRRPQRTWDAGDRGLIDTCDSPYSCGLCSCFPLIFMHTVCMDSAQLPDLEGLDREALKALLVQHQEQLISLPLLTRTSFDCSKLSSRANGTYSLNRARNCEFQQRADRSSELVIEKLRRGCFGVKSEKIVFSSNSLNSIWKSWRPRRPRVKPLLSG